MLHDNQSATPALDDLPRLTDEEIEAAESGYVAVEGVPSNEPTTPLQFLDRLQNISSLELGRAVQALKQLCQLADAGDRDSVPIDLLECVLHRLEHAEASIDHLCADALRTFRPQLEVRS